uniref:Uncharacterized protein n=1 Tax=Anopheles maculatus TaxID=74869 RepID=A0A182SIZ4_9DIPT
MELLQKPKSTVYLSDESPTVLNRSHSFSDGELNYSKRVHDCYDKYEFVDGRKHYLLKDERLKERLNDRYGRERAVGYERSGDRRGRCDEEYERKGRRMLPDGEEDDPFRRPEMFPKCKSRSSSLVSNEEGEVRLRRKVYHSDSAEDDDGGEEEEGDDEVFESSFSRGRNSSFNGKSSLKRRARYDTRRTSSLEGLDQFLANLKDRDRHDRHGGREGTYGSSKSDSARHSSVSINEKPEYFEYAKSPSSPYCTSAGGSGRSASSRKPANYASTLSSNKSSNGVALLQTTPKRPSMKKSSNTSMAGDDGGGRSRSHDRHSNRSGSPSTASGTRDHPQRRTRASHSDYDVRGRSRYGGHNGGRDAYRQRDRERDRDRNSSDQERDRDLSDREQRESRERGELDQSLSNTEGTPEDKIGR